MTQRIRVLGIVMIVLGLVFAGAGIYAFTQVQAGSDSLQAFSTAQNVTLSYDEDGNVMDRGSAEAGAEILRFLEEEWGYPVNYSEMDPNDPIVNTGSEYMYQMAVIGHHTLYADQTVVIAESTEYEGETFDAGEYTIYVRTVGERGELGGYWTDFDRMHPVEGPARSQAWSGTVHGLFGELGVGAVTANMLTLSTGIAAMIFGLGLTVMLLGGGLVWIGSSKEDDKTVAVESSKPEPATT
ncbi:MAG: hypothetical protein ACR2N9_03395 [Acidimicrobiia bacterium]